jgi:hypothetical protein
MQKRRSQQTTAAGRERCGPHSEWGNGEQNKLLPEERPVHDWYRFVLSFPPHLVRTYLERFDIGPQHCVLDPFCGTGTTLVECKKRGEGYMLSQESYALLHPGPQRPHGDQPERKAIHP